MKLSLLFLLSVVSITLIAQTNNLTGEWRGTSLCQLKNSSCHDETVVYRISPINEAGSIKIVAYKLVNNELDSMGTLFFKYNAKEQTLKCVFKENWIWLFHISSNKINGTLTRLNDNVLFRKITISKIK